MNRKSHKGLLGIIFIVVGIILIGNSIIDVVENNLQ